MTTITKTKAPFRADHVGSLLRPDSIHQARKDFKDGTITAEQLHEIETEEIKHIVDKQIEVGLELVTDGEFRRRFWHTDFQEHLNGIEGYVPEVGYIFHGEEETERYNVRNTGKISFLLTLTILMLKSSLNLIKLLTDVPLLNKLFQVQTNYSTKVFVM